MIIFFSFFFVVVGQVGGSGSPSIAALDSSSMNFRSSLAALDRMPTRYCDSVFVLYCKKGQDRVEDILTHQVSSPNDFVLPRFLVFFFFFFLKVAFFFPTAKSSCKASRIHGIPTWARLDC